MQSERFSRRIRGPEMRTRYGWVEIDGVRYDHDVVIHADRSVNRRSKKKSKKLKRQYGHTPLSDADLGFLDGDNAEILFIGTGQYGDLPITMEAHTILAKRETVIRPTPEILSLMEDERRPFAAVLHVCC